MKQQNIKFERCPSCVNGLDSHGTPCPLCKGTGFVPVLSNGAETYGGSIMDEEELLTEETLRKIYPPPGSDEFPEYDVCDDCPMPLMAQKAQLSADNARCKKRIEKLEKIIRGMMTHIEKQSNAVVKFYISR